MKIKMGTNAKILFFSIFSNTLLFLTVILSIQNSNTTRKINFFRLQTIPLPISFIVASSFIIGSISSSLVILGKRKNNN
tara:strand:+ start:224 stop:460 length:237 start_codon:yes stop_codon:yes gene_type:complete